MRAISRKLLPGLSNQFGFGLTGSSYISVAVARKVTGFVRMNHHDNDYLMKTTFGLVLPVAMYTVVKLLDTFLTIQRYCPKRVSTLNNIVPVNSDDASGS